MNLVEVYNSLEVPNTGNRNLFNAITLTDFPFVKIAANNEGLPVILISILHFDQTPQTPQLYQQHQDMLPF